MKPLGILKAIVILYLDLYTGLKIPGMFITLNSKMQVVYEIVFKEKKEIISVNGTLPILL